METKNRLKAIWSIIRGHKTLFKATPRIVVKPGDQEMFYAIMSERLRLVDTSPVFQEGTFFLPEDTFNVGNPIILGHNTKIVGKEITSILTPEPIIDEPIDPNPMNIDEAAKPNASYFKGIHSHRNRKEVDGNGYL